MTPKTRDLIELAQAFTDINAQIKHLKAQLDQVDREIRAQINEGETLEAGDYTVMLKPGAQRIDAKKLQEKYPPSDYADFYDYRPVTAKVRKAISEDDLLNDGIITHNRASVVVKPVEATQ